jgi:hypothetical protein
MATRAEQFHAQEERKGRGGRRKARGNARPGVPPGKRSRSKAHAARKAPYALEAERGKGRPSRKSTRSSANRAKPDTRFNLVEQARKGSPTSRFHKDAARTSRTRGG